MSRRKKIAIAVLVALVAGGAIYLPGLYRRVVGLKRIPVSEEAERRAVVEPLTKREETILRYLASSLSNTEIANELYVSVNTVKTHQRSVYRKLGVRSRAELGATMAQRKQGSAGPKP